MGHMASLTFWSGVLLILQICKLTSATLTFNADAVKAYQDVAQGTKRYAVFKPSSDLSTFSLVKVSDGDFKDLTTDLLASKEDALGAFSNAGKSGNELLVLIWLPSGNTEEVSHKYSAVVDELETLFSKEIWLSLISDLQSDFNLTYLVDNAAQGYNRIVSSQVDYGVTETTEVITVNVELKPSIQEVSLGSKRYVILKFTDDFSSVVLDKVADLSATFADLAADLKKYEASGEVRIVIYFVPVVKDGVEGNKVLLILWVPSTADKTLVSKYETKLKSLKASLKVPVWDEVEVTTTSEVSVEGINKLLPANTGQILTTTSTDEVVTLDAKAQSSVNEVSQGTKRYVVLKFSDDFSSVVADKVADLSADFADLASYLKQFEASGQLRVVVYFVPVLKDGATENRVLLLLWAPSTADKALVSKYLLKVKLLKSSSFLKLPVWNEVTVKSVSEVTPDGINKLLPAGSGQVQEPVKETPATTGQVEVTEELSDEDDDEPAQLDPNVDSVVEDVKKGTKKYVTLKWSPTNSLVVDKTGAPNAKFDDLVKDLVAAEKAGEGRYAFFNDNGKLLLVVWAPSSLPDKQKVLYKKKLVKVKKLLKKNFSYVVPQTAQELDLPKLLKTVKEFDFVTWFSKLLKKLGKPEDEDEDEDDDEPAQLDPKVDPFVEDVKKGTKKYVTLKWTPTNTLVVDKTGAPNAKFDDLVKDLVAAEKSGEGRYAFFNDNGKLLLVVWVPSSLPDKQKVLYKKKLVKVKKMLKKNFSYVVTQSVPELDLTKLVKNLKNFDFASWFLRQFQKLGKFDEEDDEDDGEPAQLDSKVDTVVDDVKKGTKRYVTLKWTPTNILVVDKTGGPDAKFDDLVKDLAAAEKSGEGRYAFYNDKGKLLLVVWVPSSVPEAQKVLYKRKLKKLKKLLKKSFLYVVSSKLSDLNLDALLKSASSFDFNMWLSKFEWKQQVVFHGDSDEEPDDGEPATLDPSTEAAIDEVISGKRKYVTAKWTSTNSLVVDKSGAAGAKFDDLVKELVAAQKAGEGRYAFYHDSDKNKLVVLVWIPSDVPEKQQTLYKRKFTKVKKLLKRSFSYVIIRSASELNLSTILKSLSSLNFGSFFSGQGWQKLKLDHSENDGKFAKDGKGVSGESGWTTHTEQHFGGDQGGWQVLRQ